MKVMEVIPVEQKIEAGPLSLVPDIVFPLNQRYLGNHQLKQDVKKNPGQIRFRTLPSLTTLRRDQGTYLGRVDGTIL